MNIQELTLYSTDLSAQKDFYAEILELKIIEETSDAFTVQAGSSKLTFRQSDQEYLYHFCFLIPTNKLQESIGWLKDRLEIMKIGGEFTTQVHEEWNAESVYFYDAAGNIAEFIVRNDLEIHDDSAFNSSQILCVNEIGMPSSDVKKTNQLLEEQTGSKFWKGDLERFGTNGSQMGIFLLANDKIKETWFPTDLKIQRSPFEVKGKVNEKTFEFSYANGKIDFEAQSVLA